MKREEINREGISGLWILTDSEMFRLSMYATEAAKRFRKKGGKALAREAEQTAEEIDSILQTTDYYRTIVKGLAALK